MIRYESYVNFDIKKSPFHMPKLYNSSTIVKVESACGYKVLNYAYDVEC